MVLIINKKGISDLIAWVLLVGLSVALGALVTNWAINNVRSYNPGENANKDLYCPDVSISINNTCHIKNNGMFSITKLIVQSNLGTTRPMLTPALLPGQVAKLDQLYSINCQPGYGYIPVVVDEEGKDVVCVTSKVTL